MIIYEATNLINGKRYIGKTVYGLHKRKMEHLLAAKNNKENVYFHLAIQKHGEHSFSWKILTHCENLKDLSLMEKYYIELFKSNQRDYGYNLTNGGEGCEGYKHTDAMKMYLSELKKGMYVGCKNGMYGKTHSEKTREAHSLRMRGENHPFFGKKRSEQTRKKIGLGNKGRKISDEQKAVMSAKMKALWNKIDSPYNKHFGSKYFLGRKHSDETKEKMRKAALS